MSESSDKIYWLDTLPLSGKPIYPVILDIIESVRKILKDNSFDSICSDIAKSYEELTEKDKVKLDYKYIENYILKFSNYSSNERYILSKLAYEVSLLGNKFGVIFYNPEYFDIISQKFLSLLINQSKKSGLHIAIDTAKDTDLAHEFYPYTRNFKSINKNINKLNVLNTNEYFLQIVAASPHGLPLHVLESIVDHYDETSLCIREGSMEEKWFYLPMKERNYIYKKTPIQLRKSIYTKLVDVWNPAGWGYLRKGSYAIGSKDVNRIIQYHPEYIEGMKIVGIDFLYSLFLSLLQLNKSIDLDTKLYFLVSTARLALKTTLKRRGGINVAVTYLQRAIKNCNNLHIKAYLMNDIALLYAYQKDKSSLQKSRIWYYRAFSIISKIEKGVKRDYIEILLNHGLALVEYHEGNAHKALMLELKAYSISQQNRETKEWGSQLSNFNISKLMMKKFHNEKIALQYLKKNLFSKLPEAQHLARIELAKHYFDKRDYNNVVKILTDLYEQNNIKETEGKEHELLGRLIFATSLYKVKEINRASIQIPFLQKLCDIFDSSGGYKLLQEIKLAIFEAKPKHV